MTGTGALGNLLGATKGLWLFPLWHLSSIIIRKQQWYMWCARTQMSRSISPPLSTLQASLDLKFTYCLQSSWACKYKPKCCFHAWETWMTGTRTENKCTDLLKPGFILTVLHDTWVEGQTYGEENRSCLVKVLNKHWLDLGASKQTYVFIIINVLALIWRTHLAPS